MKSCCKQAVAAEREAAAKWHDTQAAHWHKEAQIAFDGRRFKRSNEYIERSIAHEQAAFHISEGHHRNVEAEQEGGA